MYITVILIVVFIISMFTVKFVKEGGNNCSLKSTDKMDRTRINNKYNLRRKVIFEETDKNFIRNAMGALQWRSVSEGELKYMEYFEQTLFFDNTKVEDCIALKILIEKYLNLNVWQSTIDVLEKYIK